MMSSHIEGQIQIHIDPSVQDLSISLGQYLRTRPQYDKLVVSAFIFDFANAESLSRDDQRRLLIVQRAKNERSYANLWEIPGGSSDPSDPTIIHSLAREVFEETGLRMTKVLRQVGKVIEFTTGWGSKRKKWAKLNFEIQVAEIQNERPPNMSALEPNAPKSNAANPTMDSGLVKGSQAGKSDVVVKIDPEEHQDFAWASLADIQTNKYAIATLEQRNLMLEAFQL